MPLASALTHRRLLVVKVAARAETEGEAEVVTLEVSHEALLRRWPTLAKLLDEDRNDVLLLDGVLQAAIDWEKAEADRKTDYLAHRASRLSDAQALKSRGYDWEREIAPASDYLVACQAREDAERQEKGAALEREQARLAEIAAAQAQTTRLQQRARWSLAVFAALVLAGIALVYRQHAANLDLSASLKTNRQELQTKQLDLETNEHKLQHEHANLLGELASVKSLRGNLDGALRMAAEGVRGDLALPPGTLSGSPVAAQLAALVSKSDWRLSLSGHENFVCSAAFIPDGAHIVTASGDKTARIWDACRAQKLIMQ